MYYLVKVKHEIGVDSDKGMIYKKIVSTYCVYEGDGIIENCLNKATVYFQENLRNFTVKSISDCVIMKYIGNSVKQHTYQCRIHFKIINDKGAEKIGTEYYLVDADNLTEAEEQVTKEFKDTTIDYEIYSINRSKINEIIE